MNRIGVGIVGASSGRGWARVASIPALRTLDASEIRDVSTSRRETDNAMAQRLGIGLAFDSHRDLISRPENDLVVVCVKVADHYPIVVIRPAFSGTADIFLTIRFRESPAQGFVHQVISASPNCRKQAISQRDEVSLRQEKFTLIYQVDSRSRYMTRILAPLSI